MIPEWFAEYGLTVEQVAKNQERTRNVQRSRIGIYLAEILEREAGEQIECQACKHEILMLNRMTPEDAQAEAPALAARIADRAKRMAPKVWQRVVMKVDAFAAQHTPAPSLAEKIIARWIRDAIEREQADPYKATAPPPPPRQAKSTGGCC